MVELLDCFVVPAATFFYAMLRLIRLQTTLKATINQVIFGDLLKSVSCTVSIRECVADLENPCFFKAFYVLLHAVFPPLRVLRYCDSNKPMMDKVYYLTYRASEALKKSVELLEDEGVFESWIADSELSINYQDKQAEIAAEADDRFVQSFTFFMFTDSSLTLTASQ